MAKLPNEWHITQPAPWETPLQFKHVPKPLIVKACPLCGTFSIVEEPAIDTEPTPFLDHDYRTVEKATHE